MSHWTLLYVPCKGSLTKQAWWHHFECRLFSRKPALLTSSEEFKRCGRFPDRIKETKCFMGNVVATILTFAVFLRCKQLCKVVSEKSLLKSDSPGLDKPDLSLLDESDCHSWATYNHFFNFSDNWWLFNNKRPLSLCLTDTSLLTGW